MAQSLAVRRSGDPAILKHNSAAVARVNEVLGTFADRDHNGEILTAVRRFPARAAEFAEWPEWVVPELRAAYAGKGIARPYTHQTQAAEAVHAGRNVVIVTPTASGKTLCYNLPVINSILENEDTRALYLFPTKALAQDQLAELYDVNQRLEHDSGITAAKNEKNRGHSCATTFSRKVARRRRRPLQMLRFATRKRLGCLPTTGIRPAMRGKRFGKKGISS